MSDALALRPLRADEFDAWAKHVTELYAVDIAENGDTSRAVAEQKAVDDMAEILPAGLATPGHLIFALDHAGTTVGTLWLAEREVSGRQAIFVYDIEVDAAFRGRGFGRAAMLLAEEQALALGIHRIELNVFGGNTTARNLYLSLGYGESSVKMGKNLP